MFFKMFGDAETQKIFMNACKDTYNEYTKISFIKSIFISLFWPKSAYFVGCMNNENALRNLMYTFLIYDESKRHYGLNQISVYDSNTGKCCYVYVSDTILNNIKFIKGEYK